MREPPPRRRDQENGTRPPLSGLLTVFQVWEAARDRARKWELPPFDCEDIANRVMDAAAKVRATTPGALGDTRAVQKYTDMVIKNARRAGTRGADARARFNAELASELQSRQAASSGASDDETDDGRYALYDAFVESLGDVCRVIWGLRYVDGMSLPDIAKARGISVETVKTHIKRGLRKLERRRLAQDKTKQNSEVPS